MSGRTVLLVDDSRIARMMTRSAVAGLHPDWTILEAATGEDALAMAATAPPDFVLMDVNMPGMGGLETARLFRQHFPAAVISLLTASILDSVRDQAGALGIGYIVKPFEESSLARFLDGEGGPP